MRRTTILLDDDLADQLDYERRRRNQSTAAIVREALAEYLAGGKSQPTRRRLGFANLGRSGHRDTSEKFDEILAREWPAAILADSVSSAAPPARRKRQTATARRRR